MTLQYSEENALRANLLGDINHAELMHYLDTVGNGSGTKSMAAAAATYRIKPPLGYIYVVEKLVITLTDNAAFAGNGFGSLSALGNGLLIEIREKPGDSDEQVIQDITNGVAVKTNAELGALGELVVAGGAADCFVQATIKPAGPWRIEGKRGESLVVQTRESMAGLAGLYAMAHGRIYTNDV